ncbi:hypothetical protein H6F77_12750 [Microcoleus sp. FACHB-831]|uniref:hypothetical protein n=1 Tax=Microcoleus sp. FACHB-831 TaxID=2692827 RepID=UPI0016860F60|nr:hypothetical protein [Microcoleus sp. FACHB-831]MBD1921954.1 hypothetical protein [Microcoleus sp. FACHB-831]
MPNVIRRYAFRRCADGVTCPRCDSWEVIKREMMTLNLIVNDISAKAAAFSLMT